MFKLENYHLKSSSFFDTLNDKEKKQINEVIIRQEYKKEQVIFREGSYSKGVYIIRKGKVKIFKSDSHGAHSIIYIYRKGDYFGYRPLLADDPNPVSASAMDQVIINFIPKDAFLRLFSLSENLSKKVALTLAMEFSVWINKMTIFTQFSVKERLAISLLILSKIYEREDGRKSEISMNRADLASFVGTAKESLVRTLRLFKDEKIITTQGTKIVVLKPDQLFGKLN